MGNLEETAVQLLYGEIVEKLNLRNYVIDFYYSRSHFSDEMLETILAIENHREQNEAFLRDLLQNGDVGVFIEALEYGHTHVRIASKLKVQIAELKREAEERLSRLMVLPSRSDTRCAKMRKMVRLNFKLREITSRGKYGHDQFRHIITTMRNQHRQDSDVLFHMFDADSAFLRVFYQQSVEQDEILNNMELLVNSTKHPTASRMVYLARKGSYIAMKGKFEMGLEYLKNAKTLAVQLHPCKDTGMVQYVETNILLQKYERSPDPETKDRIIRNITHSIQYDFSDEEDPIKEDYIKMMNLKLIFCYLGISCLCDVVLDWALDENDIKKTKDCLDKIESLPGQLYNRHLMFYHFAGSVLFFRRGYKPEAMMLAKKAESVARESSYLKELERITLFLDRIEYWSIQETSTSVTCM